ncbi:STAS domain-containing protein [Pseudoxanthomonas suwonensis]|uniref:STAS domain-containing protein n=1 Tax=Pseudoxanthomonas suwonensis TaxID=314722 RepID=UPI00048E3547|nr:STAS domain-containing protein [Pseudoxanthomonas suwonensis]
MATTASPAPALRREGTVLHLAGALDRAAATAAWPALPAVLDGADTLDLSAVTRLDSAGLALLAEAAARIGQRGTPATLVGAPEGLAELRAAYRLHDDLAYADAAP